MKKYVIRPGDTVRIINPEFFLRCGYPLSLKDGIKMVLEDEKDKELFHGLCDHFGISITNPRKDYYRIIDILAYYKIRNSGFGGRERKIYTRKVEEAKGHEFTVLSKKMVMTGHYVPGTNFSYFDECEHEPPYLEGAKSHMILYLHDGCVDGDFFYVENVTRPLDRNQGWILTSNDNCPLAIERCNVEVVTKEKNNAVEIIQS